MGLECKVYIVSCSCCSLNRRPMTWPRACLCKYHAGALMERLHIEILGPFTSSTTGNVYVLMLMNQFTKWFEWNALPNQTTKSIVEKVLNKFIARFVCPLYLHSDQGRNVDGKLVRAICDLLEITKTYTTPYRPCRKGLVERYNRLLLQMIRCYIEGAQKNWDKHLPQLVAAILAMPN